MRTRIRFYELQRDQFGVGRLVAEAEPGAPPHDGAWYFCHPTLLLYEGLELVGATSFAFGLPPIEAITWCQGEACYGHGVWVHPAHRQQGHGWTLAAARHELARQAGITFFLGMTSPGNTAMRRIFERQHLTVHNEIPGAYPYHSEPDQAGLVYAGRIA